MTYSIPISDLPATERPRERLAAQGPSSLSNSELLAILLGSGQGKGKLSAVGLGHIILKTLGTYHQDPLTGLRDTTIEELTQIHGVGFAKATSILAAVELGKRIAQSRPLERTIVDSPSVAAAAMGEYLMWQAQERLVVLLLDGRNGLIATQLVTIGSATETLAPPREIFQSAVRQGAVQIVVGHNHPSGSLSPSDDDIELTRRLLIGAQVLEIPLVDHLILGRGDHVSLRKLTDLWLEIPQGE